VGSYKCVSGRGFDIAVNQYFDSQRALDTTPKLRLSDRGPLFAVIKNHSGSNCVAAQLSKSPIKISQIIDGTSKTLLIGEYVTISGLARSAFWANSFYGMNMGTVTLPLPCYPGMNAACQTQAAQFGAQFDPDYDKCRVDPFVKNTCYHTFASVHPGGIMNFAHCDGSVQTIANTIDMFVIGNMATVAGGEAN
jgi:prepilin-type processing-associated H-X9-DG protein